MGPLNGERGGQMSDGGLGRVVRSLWLWNVDNGTAHAANHDDAALGLASHQVLGDGARPDVGTVDIDTPELLHTVVRVGDGVKVFGETGRSDQVVNLAVLLDDIGENGVHRIGVGHVGIVSSDLGESVYKLVLLSKMKCKC